MKKNLIAAAAATVVFVSGVAIAQDEQEMPSFSPVETFTCNYKEGKGPADLDAVVAEWNAWMDERDDNTYFAATITPYYFGDDTFDFGWLGAWTSGSSMGEGTDTWLADGGEYAAKFDAMSVCETHSGFAASQIKESPDDGDSDSFVITFSDCSINETESGIELFEGLNAWSAYSTERGYENSAWVLFPVYGGGGAEFDLKMVNTYDNYADVGHDWDLMASGDYLKRDELTDDVLDCDDARIYNATVRRRIPEADE